MKEKSVKLAYNQVVQLDRVGNIIPHGVQMHKPVAELIKEKHKIVTNAHHEKYVKKPEEPQEDSYEGTFVEKLPITKSEELLGLESYTLISLPKVELAPVIAHLEKAAEYTPPVTGRYRERQKKFLYDDVGAAMKFRGDSFEEY